MHPSKARKISIEQPTEMDTTSTFTDLQLSFIHSYKKNPGTNIINFVETYRNSDISAIKTAWSRVIEGESIFRQSFDLESTATPR
jgi:hypothetical protein